jgi:hypothetical protein
MEVAKGRIIGSAEWWAGGPISCPRFTQLGAQLGQEKISVATPMMKSFIRCAAHDREAVCCQVFLSSLRKPPRGFSEDLCRLGQITAVPTHNKSAGMRKVLRFSGEAPVVPF